MHAKIVAQYAHYKLYTIFILIRSFSAFVYGFLHNMIIGGIKVYHPNTILNFLKFLPKTVVFNIDD